MNRTILSVMPVTTYTEVLRKCAKFSVQGARRKSQRKWSCALKREYRALWESEWLRRCQLSEHERFEELASLAAIGELSPDEHEEFLRHKQSCSKCREIVAETRSVAATAFLAGGRKTEEAPPPDQGGRARRGAVSRRPP